MASATDADILLVDDDPGTIQLMARMLTGLGRLRFATSGEAAVRMARQTPPDLVLLDAEMPGMSGFDVCSALKADPALADTTVIFVTSHSQAEIEVAGFDLGAADFITKPVSEPLVMARVKTQLRIKRTTAELRRLSLVDALTDLVNRRGFDDALEREWLRARRNHVPMSLLMIDVDHFKRFNDCYGHPAGDAALRTVAQALKSASQRPADLVARFGGEEFVMLLPETARSGARHVAERVLGGVAAIGLPHGDSPTSAQVTVSVGLSSYDEESSCWSAPSAESQFADDLTTRCSRRDLVDAADKALYAAKRAGRARAWQLDIADATAAEFACEIVVTGGGPPARGVARS